jgi:phosphoglycolate phosphatase-like HAD superfamily hydrolase
VTRKVPDGELPPVAVFDLDGVLADARHRLHYLSGRPRNWNAFFSSAEHDPLLERGAALLHDLASSAEIVYLTGRPERNRAMTQRWLAAHGLPPARLLMRRNTDHRPARYFKREALRQLATRRKVAVVVDDDPLVVDLLRAEGFPARLADWVPHERTLQLAQERLGRS